MKVSKRTIPFAFVSFLILILSHCSDDRSFSFGETQTDFDAGSVYQAKTDGFLSVQYSSATNFGSIQGDIYSDNTEGPTTVIGMVNMVPGSIVVPVKRKNYWKVTSLSYCEVSISWTPIE